MLRRLAHRRHHAHHAFSESKQQQRSHVHNLSQTVRHEPLRILFCGADEFSIYSLQSLHRLQQNHNGRVDSIEVICRPDKRVGRGLKRIQQVPIKAVAAELGLKLHQLDSFKDFKRSSPIDLVVAVSFGLLVPASLLKTATYGGLNVHPSLLPEFRGAAPIQHALLQRRLTTGVTLQTMHPTKFDHGLILNQAEVAIPPESRPQDLVELLGPMGAQLLVDGLQNGSFIDPKPLETVDRVKRKPSYAPKLGPDDRRIDWGSWTAEDIFTKDRVLGSLWDDTTYAACSGAPQMTGNKSDAAARRVKYTGPWQIAASSDAYLPLFDRAAQAGGPVHLTYRDGSHTLAFLCHEQGFPYLLQPTGVTIEGEAKAGGFTKLLAMLTRRLENSTP